MVVDRNTLIDLPSTNDCKSQPQAIPFSYLRKGHIRKDRYAEPSVGELQKLAKLYSITVDELINPEEVTLKEVVIEDKTVSEKVRLISQLDQEDQHAVYRIIDGMLTKNKFQTFFEQNLQPAK
jgi:transcriptional regulator with XRE-family HTH domain